MLVALYLSLLSALLYILSFPPFGVWILAWFSLIPLLFLLDRVSSKRGALFWSWFTGFLSFMAIFHWIVGFTADWPMPLISGNLFVGGLAVYLALYIGLAGLFIWMLKSWPILTRLFLISFIWVVLEYLRSVVFTGFGWGSIGHSQSENKYLIQIADMTGVWGVSFLVVLGNAAIYFVLRDFLFKKKIGRDAGISCGVTIVLIVMALGYGVWVLRHYDGGAKRVRIAVVQPNILLQDTWNRDKWGEITAQHISVSRGIEKLPVDLIVWPETALPFFVHEQPDLLNQVKVFANAQSSPVLFGAMTNKGQTVLYNSALWIDKNGNEAGVYNKRHLIPYGEYVPFRREIPLIDKLADSPDYTSGDRPVIFDLPHGLKASPLICFEDSTSEVARDAVFSGANILINLTNDAWFGDSPGPLMHLENAVFRTVENHVPLVRAANTGLSCYIDAYGDVVGCVHNAAGKQLMVPGSAVFDVRAGGKGSFYTKFGDVFVYLCGLFLLGLTIGMKFWVKRS